jgi:hypothetical protein
MIFYLFPKVSTPTVETENKVPEVQILSSLCLDIVVNTYVKLECDMSQRKSIIVPLRKLLHWIRKYYTHITAIFLACSLADKFQSRSQLPFP